MDIIILILKLIQEITKEYDFTIKNIYNLS